MIILEVLFLELIGTRRSSPGSCVRVWEPRIYGKRIKFRQQIGRGRNFRNPGS